jgi:hypothetical protein
MRKQELSSRHFQPKISKFCEIRIAPVASKRTLEKIKPYLTSLVTYRESPPLRNGRIDWTTVIDDCGIDDEISADLKKQFRIALDAITRWLGAPPLSEDRQKPKPSARQGNATHDASKGKSSSTRKPRRTGDCLSRPDCTRVSRGPKPKPIHEFPEPLFDVARDPESFQEALAYQMRRFGESYWQLYRAVVRLDETFDHKTMLSWFEGKRVPRSVASFRILSRIEKRYRLPEGYFKAKLPHQNRSLHGHDLGDISPAERRRIAVHLPDDFSSLPFSKQEEIVDWVRRVIVSGTTDYRRYQAKASKQRYAIRFPGVTYGGGSLSPREHSLAENINNTAAESFEDPDLLSGVVDAPPLPAMSKAVASRSAS